MGRGWGAAHGASAARCFATQDAGAQDLLVWFAVELVVNLKVPPPFPCQNPQPGPCSELCSVASAQPRLGWLQHCCYPARIGLTVAP